MAKPRARITLVEPLDLELRDGSVVRVSPGPYGRGIAVVHLLPRGLRRGPGRPPKSANYTSGKRGRKPRLGTVALRERLQSDSQAGRLKDPVQYVKWIIEQDTGMGLPLARTIVYREMRAYR